MHTYTVELTDAECKAFEHIALDVQEWIDNAAKNRARIAMDDIYNAEVTRMVADPSITTIPADKEAVVLAADIKSVVEMNAEAEAALPLGE